MSYNIISCNVQVVLKITNGPTAMDSEKPAHPLPAWFAGLWDFGVSGEELPAIDDGEEMEYDDKEIEY